MGHRSPVGSLLLYAAVIVAAAGLIFSCSNGEPKVQKTAVVKKTAIADSSPKTRPIENRQIVVYYFHGNARCPTCYKLENYAKSVVETDFTDAIKTGTLEWKTINVEDRGNEHYSEDYKLYTKSVIISIRQGDKETSWKNLDQIWQLVREEQKYREYIRSEVKACLDGKCL